LAIPIEDSSHRIIRIGGIMMARSIFNPVDFRLRRAISWSALAFLAISLPAAPAIGETPTTVLHAFSFTDGSDPAGSVIGVGKYLFGMTEYGGTAAGVIYRIDRSNGEFSVLHNFTSGTGIEPWGDLIEVGGKLYGMTKRTTGYHVLHAFGARPAGEGAGPQGTLVHSNGYLYGLTTGGGDYVGGVVFRYGIADTSHVVLHHFEKYTPLDGWGPLGSPIVIGDVIYGMTHYGGAGASGDDGTIFRIDTDGTDFQLLHSFSRLEADNGTNPYGNLANIGEVLYGMTRLGGSDGSFGLGTIFKSNTNGTGFQLLHRFLGPDYNPEGDDDGMEPYGSLMVHGSYLYGMTPHGGSNGMLQGTIFRIKPDGSDYEILHNFAGGTADGKYPLYATPWCEGGTLYTATRDGGSSSNYGAVVSMAIEDVVSVPEGPGQSIGQTLTVGAPFPNPGIAGGTVAIPVHLPSPDQVVLELYTPSGRLVANRQAAEFTVAGRHEIRWAPAGIPPGTYYVRVRTGSGLQGGTRWTVLR
jgi:uncharacterized repeat protein (TIGR03803 family)